MAVVKISRAGFPAASSADASAAMSAGTDRITITASSDTDESPRVAFPAGALALIVGAGVVAYVLDTNGNLRAPLKLGVDVSAFALIYVATQGIERLLEPVSSFVHPVTDDKKDARSAKAAVQTAATPDDAVDKAKVAANSAATVNRKQSERAILFWSLASLIGIVISAWLGLHFIAILLDPGSQAAIPRWFDVVLTGLVIGGGTKLVHGLVERVSKPKEDEGS